MSAVYPSDEPEPEEQENPNETIDRIIDEILGRLDSDSPDETSSFEELVEEALDENEEKYAGPGRIGIDEE